MLEQHHISQPFKIICKYIIINYRQDFIDKNVMDLGTGSGILAIFSAAAGAEKV
jgi:ribosomal protein L11 methylase PrmA